MLQKTIYTGVFFVMLMMSVQAQQIWYVRENGMGDKDGSSWEHAAADLEKTVQQASVTDTVWVAAGIYNGGFSMKDGVQVYGGFSGIESSLKERELPGSGRNLTFLDGNNQFRVLTQEQTFTYPTVWDGFVICNGVANEGGGVYLRSNGIIRRSIIRQNISGIPSIGEYSVREGGVVFRVDVDNKKAWILAMADYGANYQIGVAGSNAKNELEQAFQDMNGSGNTTGLAGGRAVQALKKYRADSPAQSYDDWYLPSVGEWAVLIADNDKNKKSLVFDLVESAHIKNNKMPLSGKRYWTSTTALQNGMSSAWYVDFATSDISVSNIWQYNKLRGVRVFDYKLDNGKGGAVFATTGSKIEGCLIYNNVSALGYAVCARGEIYISSSTIVGNVSEVNSVNSFAVDGNSQVKLNNTIVTGNFDASTNSSNYDNDIIYEYSAIETTQTLSPGNINLMTMQEANGANFVNPALNDYRLQSNSVCVAAGNVRLLPIGLDTDLAGNPRSVSNNISIGAYEYDSESTIDFPFGETSISIYPVLVCAGDSFRVEIHEAILDMGDVSIGLYNLLGVKLAAFDAQRMNIIQSPSIGGVYIVRISKGSELHKEFKIVVQ